MWILTVAAAVWLMVRIPIKVQAAFEIAGQARMALCMYVLGIRVFFRRAELTRSAPGVYGIRLFRADGAPAAEIPLRRVHLNPQQKRWLHRLDKRRAFFALRRAFSLRMVSLTVETAGFDAARTALRHGAAVSLLGAMDAKLYAARIDACLRADVSFAQNAKSSAGGGCILATNLGKLIVAALRVAKSQKK